MAIFKKDLENINELNKKNQQKIYIKSELLQFINLQNEASDYDFSDFKFELNVNFRERFNQHKKIFSEVASRRIAKNKFGELFNLFNKFTNINNKIYSSFERLVFSVKEENDLLFDRKLSLVSNSLKNSKRNSFDLTHSFLINCFPENITDDNALLADTSSLYTVSKNLEVIEIKDTGVNDTKILNTYTKLVENPIRFLQSYAGFNFLKADNSNFITNYNKPLSLMTLSTAINNIIENSFDYASCNSLFKGIYTYDELNSKIRAVDFTSLPIIESDITKEILPIKYVDTFESINQNELKQLINDFNSELKNSQNIKKSNSEIIPDDIFKFENFLSGEDELLPQCNFTIKTVNSNSNLNNEEPKEIYLPSKRLLDVITNQSKNNIVSIGYKKNEDYMECLNLIGNHVNSNQVKLIYGVVNKKNNRPDYSNIKTRPVIDASKKGILNYKFEDINDFASNIIKTRLMCNNIVKKFKKYKINKGYDASSTNVNNKINYFLQSGGIRRRIEKDINTSNLKDSILQINSSNNTSTKFFESFNNQNNIFEIFKKTYNKINPNLIIINNSILGETNLDALKTPNSDFINVINLNEKINDIDDTLNLDLNSSIRNEMKTKKEEIKKFTDEYYSSDNPLFLNTTSFFQGIKNICSNNLKWHLNKKPNTSADTDRADILNNASILWLFNDSCKEMTKADKESFQNNFINLLISYMYISSKSLGRDMKNSYNLLAENIILNEGPTPSTITEIAPFFSFFTSEDQTPSSFFSSNPKNKTFMEANEHYNTTPNVFETNGKSTHFLSIQAQLSTNKDSNGSMNSGHKLVNSYNLGEVNNFDKFNEDKKNILLAGYNRYLQNEFTNIESTVYCFMPQLTFKKVKALNQTQTTFEYFLYNSAMLEFYSKLTNANSYELFDVLSLLFPTDNVSSSELTVGNSAYIPEYIKQLSYSFKTKNSFLHVLNFENTYGMQIESNALINNIFYQIASLFKEQINDLNLNQNAVNLFSQLNAEESNKRLADLKFMIKNTLKIASSIYCKMFNNLQSYTNLADRIYESNYFYENSFDNQRLLTHIRTGKTNPLELKKYSKDMWSYYSNIFLGKPDLYTNFQSSDFQKFRSFASKKFIYFLNEVLGIEKNEIEVLMEKILSYNVNNENQVFLDSSQVNEFSNNNLFTRHQRLAEYFLKSTTDDFTQGYFTSIEEALQGPNLREDLGNDSSRIPLRDTFKDLSVIEFMTNPFELFNLYESTLFQSIQGLYNSNSTTIDKDYQIEVTPNLTIMNLFKAGNDASYSFIDDQINNNINYQSAYARIISPNEINSLSKALRYIDLFKFKLLENFGTYNITEVNAFSQEEIKRLESTNINFLSNGSTVVREISSNLIKAATYTVGRNQTIGQLFNSAGVNFFDDINIYIKFSDSEQVITAGGGGGLVLIPNKQNYSVSPRLSSFNLFDLSVDNSFNFSENYDNVLVRKNTNNQTKFEIENFSFDTLSSNNLGLVYRKSGLKESYSYSQNFMNINKALFIPEINLDYTEFVSQQMLNQKYIDINLNWYNHILHGLITNDLGLAFSHDILLYYYDNFLTDFISKHNKLKDNRKQKKSINNFNLAVTDAKNNISVPGFDQNLLSLSADNVKLQKNYMKSLIKQKSLKNTITYNGRTYSSTDDFIQDHDIDLSQFIEKITNLNKQNENGDFFMSYFDDFYMKDLWYPLLDRGNETVSNRNARNALFIEKINKNYQRNDNNNNVWNVPNQAETVVGSHILSVGIDNSYKLDKDDIILIKVEMTDHDFPEIIWEPKVFEYYAAFEDIENVFLQHKSSLKVSSIDNITYDNLPIGINSSYFEVRLNDNNNKITLKDALIQKSKVFNSADKIINGLDLSNNIGSLNYTGEKSYLNPIIYQNNINQIFENLNLSNDNFIESKIPVDFKNKLTQQEFQKLKEDLMKRCIHNQRMNFRLKKISKLLNGFEPNSEFSLVTNKWMQDLFVLSDVYKIFIEDFQNQDNNVDNIKELYPFTYEEISNAVKLNQYNYLGLNFHKLHFTTNHKLNIYLQFMSDFTKALLPDFVSMTKHNFQKVYTLAVNPKDFIITGFSGGNGSFVPNSSELEFEQIIYAAEENNIITNIRNKILDEIGTETSLVLRLISDKTDERDDLNYYHVINKKNNRRLGRYIPKNVSYRISTMVLE